MILYSVVIPAYNNESFIRNSMMSVINQTYKNIELIVVNDGSTDNTEFAIQNVINEFPDFNIKYKRIENNGPSTARNEGIKLATGDYICFLDSDDSYNQNLFAELSEIKDDYDICYFGWEEISEESSKVLFKYEDSFKFLEEPISGIEAAKKKFNKEIWLCNCNEVYKTSLIKDNNLKYPDGVFSGEDTYFIYCCLANAKKVISFPKNYFYNVIRETSLMHSKFSEKNLTLLSATKQLVEYEKKNINNPELHLIFYSTYYYGYIVLAKHLVKSIEGFNYRAFKEKMKLYLLESPKKENVILNKREKIEDFFLSHSKPLFYLLCKVVHKLKSK